MRIAYREKRDMDLETGTGTTIVKSERTQEDAHGTIN
jgi:hypothetical protein